MSITYPYFQGGGGSGSMKTDPRQLITGAGPYAFSQPPASIAAGRVAVYGDGDLLSPGTDYAVPSAAGFTISAEVQALYTYVQAQFPI